VQYCPECEPGGPPHVEGGMVPSMAWCVKHAPTPPERGYMTGDEARRLSKARRVARLTGWPESSPYGEEER